MFIIRPANFDKCSTIVYTYFTCNDLKIHHENSKRMYNPYRVSALNYKNA